MTQRGLTQRTAPTRLRPLSNHPRRPVRPVAHRLLRPRRRLLRMAGRARIGNFELIRHRGRNEAKRMRMYVRPGDSFGFDLWHMASRTLASPTAGSMMRMLFERRGVRAVRRCRTVTFQAQLIPWRPQLRAVLGAVHIVT